MLWNFRAAVLGPRVRLEQLGFQEGLDPARRDLAECVVLEDRSDMDPEVVAVVLLGVL